MASLSMFFVLVPYLVLQYRCQGIPEPEVVVLVTDVGDAGEAGSIYMFNVSQKNLTKLEVPNINKPFAIDYDVTTGHVYWTDVKLHYIRRASLDGVDDVVVASFNSSCLLGGVTLDGASRKLFYTDEGSKVIGRMDMDSLGRTVIVHTGLEQPRGIVADTTNKNIYWTELDKEEKIEMCDYSGGSRKAVVTSGLAVPSGIALDEKAGRLFWCGHDVIGSVLLDGSGRRNVDTETAMIDITIFNGLLYFTALRDKSIYTMLENGQHMTPLASHLFTKPIGIHVFSPNFHKPASCPGGQYGVSCESCGHCEEGGICEKTTGVCLRGCAPGYRMPMCREECQNNTYGTCTPCGLCAEDDPCHRVTGHCPRGCKFGWTGPTCKTGWLIFAVAGTVIAVIVVAVIVGAVYNVRPTGGEERVTVVYRDDVLRNHVRPQSHVFPQDNARPHTARVSMDFRRVNNILVMSLP
ncbi:low-density lipoprotein receptor-related protein 5-like isoform X1 [Haliotis rufescens]|uniref:low-density lipoprotein receptor-related protein 5-like isoform X1 n=1 Tax=Haliotis rufescens TaxID=6454 RepID=UPI00201ED3FB|nr:low-density lipoprotein receptor-related protein 5-like isoform X1 [Haliotis rufescens]